MTEQENTNMTAQTDRINGFVGGVGIKAPVRVVTFTNITLSGLQDIDGVTLVAEDRVAVGGQTSSIDNGLYVASATAWSRAPDCDGARDIVGGPAVYVVEGTVYAGTLLAFAGTGAKVVGTDALTFTASPITAVNIHAAAEKTTLVDADEFAVTDSASGFDLVRTTWANVKAGIFAAWGVLTAAGTNKATPVSADVIAIGDSAAANATKKSTLAALMLAWKDLTGGLVGMTLFKINFKNAADTFTSFLTNANTAARTYTFQDRDGTVADLADIAGLQAIVDSPPVTGYLAGLTMSTAGSSGTMSIAAGRAMDSGAAYLMSLAAAIDKTTSAWAVGTTNGGLDTGAIANSTWYYFYLIRRPDTGVVDVVFSASSSAPTLPANYTQYRYIGAGKTNGSAQWTSFVQIGREFWWSTPAFDLDGTGATSATLLTLSVPLGRKMKAFVNHYSLYLSYLSDPDTTNLAPSTTANPLATTEAGGDNQAFVWTNTSAQIRHRESNAGALRVSTLGWLDLADSQ